MCDECHQLEKKIQHYRKFIDEPLDALTIERIKSAIKELERRKQAKH